MKKLFLCLANSKKYGERCVAGVEVERNAQGNFKVLKRNGNPKWIRPVTRSEHGAIPEKLVKNMRLLDIYEVETFGECANGYQSENISFQQRSFKKVSELRPTSANLKLFTNKNHNLLFGCCENRITKEKVSQVHHSLMLIKAENAEIFEFRDGFRIKTRIRFEYKNVLYNFPVTDTSLLANYASIPTIMKNAKEVFLAVSLGVEYEGYYYKLAAGVICI